MSKLSSWKTIFLVCVFCTVGVIASQAETFNTLVSFNGTGGANPTNGSLVQGIDGNLYGTTSRGGAYGYGTVFEVTAAGKLTRLYSFCSQTNCTDGNSPYATLVQATNGNFYGTTYGGGPYSYGFGPGTVFEITPGGKLTTLYTFCAQTGCTDGEYPISRLVQATNGDFYGTTYAGGAYGYGTVFEITPGGKLTTLHSFGGADGEIPYGGLVQATNGNFYGTTDAGGAKLGGTVFEITAGGKLTTLYNFCSQTGCTDGSSPLSLVQATDGNLYGTTLYGGANCPPKGCGTVFEITPGGRLTTLHSFDYTDGYQPYAMLVQATDGNFYGTTAYGGANCAPYGCGTVLKITPGGTLTTLHDFDGTDGYYPYAGLVQATNGTFYGATYLGGASSAGTVFSLSVGLGPFVETEPTFGMVGAPVTILGTSLTGSTSVTFNGTPAPFTVMSPSEITTNVPAGATTGTVQVTTPSGTLSSNTDFQVTGPLQFLPVTPCRLVDTRKSGGPVQGGTSQSFPLPQLGGCNIPTTAAAYSLNVTVVPSGFLGYLTIWPTGENQPYVSTLNSFDGRVKANAAIVPAGDQGAVSVFVTNTTDVVLDIDGYFAPVSNSTLAFYPLTPCRVVDTRNPKGDLGGPSLAGLTERDFPILKATACNIPNTAQAYSLNFTAVPQGPLGYLTAWPAGQSQPYVSTLNSLTGTIVANAAIVPAGTNGAIAVFPTNLTDLVIDINGYFAPAVQGGLSLYPLAPCRVIDTRTIGNGQPFSGTLAPPVDVVDSVCGPSSLAQAYVFNATVVPAGPLGYLTLWPDGENQPFVSTLNALDGAVTSNMAIVPTNNGSIDAFASNLTQLILDISSYFAP